MLFRSIHQYNIQNMYFDAIYFVFLVDPPLCTVPYTSDYLSLIPGYRIERTSDDVFYEHIIYTIDKKKKFYHYLSSLCLTILDLY